MINQKYLLSIWAKSTPFHPLLYHMIDVGNVAMCLLSTKTFRHLINKFYNELGCSPEECVSLLAYLCAMHDIGKSDGAFQAKGVNELIKPLEYQGLKLLPNLSEGFRHERRSGKIIREKLSEQFSWELKPINTVSSSIRGHHSDFNQTVYEEPPGIKKDWDKFRDALSQVLIDIFKPSVFNVNEFKDHSKVGVLLSGLIVLSDWIASNEKLFKRINGVQDPYEYANISMGLAKNAVSTLGFSDEVEWPSNAGFNDIWKSGKFQNPRPLQKKCEDLIKSGLKPGLLIIEAPMGEGKTEAAIYVATHWMVSSGYYGIYVALPTAATSNQMYRRVKSFLDSHDHRTANKVKLVHGMAWVIDDITPELYQISPGSFDDTEKESQSWFTPKKRSLLAPYAVGTVDQALMSVLNVRFGFLRLFGLSGKVLIVDEVHAYDVYMTAILTNLLKWCATLEIPIILLSATLPSSKRSELLTAYCSGHKCTDAVITNQHTMTYPLITYTDRDGNIAAETIDGPYKHKNVELKIVEGALGNADKIATLAQNLSKNGGCICVLVNTVGTAQDIFSRLLKNVDRTTDLLIFHSRYTAERRNAIETRVLSMFDDRSLRDINDPGHSERPKRSILVATQVVEQSLDVDFDILITELAPIDLILQRIGRLHRHVRAERPTGENAVIYLLCPVKGMPDFGSTGWIYERYVLLNTMNALYGRSNIDLPYDIRELVETVYTTHPNDVRTLLHPDVTIDDLDVSYKEMLENMDSDKNSAGAYLISPPNVRRFTVADSNYFSHDEDGESASYFLAKTRIGDNTRQAIIVEGYDYLDILNNEKKPSKAIIRELFLKKANIPGWWIDGAKPEQGYEPINNGPKWLTGAVIIRMKEGIWKGKDKSEKEVVIRNDDKLGLMCESTKEHGG